MGIPFYFKHICQKYPKCTTDYSLFRTEVTNIDTLYFDLNGLIHPVSALARSEFYQKNNNELDINLAMNIEIGKEIESIISFINPEYSYLAVDGVAPFAKISQQRGRRYKSILTKNMINKVKTKHGIPIDEWDTNLISPGTPFMNSLMEYIQKNIVLNNDKIGFSSSNEVGEGEQKIFSHIRGKNDSTKIKVIYGLDADLIMLSLLANDNIFLLRDNKNKKETEKYLVLNIKELRNSLISEMKNIYRELFCSEIPLKSDTLISDYIFLCFLAGNDFLPTLPMIQINQGGIQLLLTKYLHIVHKFHKNIIKNTSINWDILLEFFQLLKNDEESQLAKYHKSYMRKNYFPIKDNDFQQQLHKIEYLPLLKKNTLINYQKPGWKRRYYSHYLNTENYMKKDINKLVNSYLTGLEWVYSYYIGECISWSWSYIYNCSPLLEDMCNYLEEYNIRPNIQHILNKPLSPHQQLLSILPQESLINLKNFEYEIKKYDYLYPIKFKLDMTYKVFLHQAIPLLPIMNYQTIINCN